MPTDRDVLRIAALELAALLEPREDECPADAARQITHAADVYFAWLAKPEPVVTAALVAGIPVDRNQGVPVSLVMPDDDQITLTMMGLDAEKVPVADPFTDPAGPYLAPFTYAVDNTALGEITVAADTLSVVLKSAPGVVGTVNVTPTDANGKVVPAFAVEIDPSATVSAGLVAGTPVPRTDTPAPAPAA